MRRKITLDAAGRVHYLGEPAADTEPDTSNHPEADGGAGTTNKPPPPVNMNDVIRAAARGGNVSDWQRLREANG